MTPRYARPGHVFAALCIAASATGAKSAPTAAAHWEVRWDEAICGLYRRGDGAKPLTLGLTFTPGLPNLDLTLANAGGDVRTHVYTGGIVAEIDIVFVPSDNRLHRGFLVHRASGYDELATVVGPDILDRLAQAKRVIFLQDRKPLASIDLPGSAKAIAGLRECRDTILRDWGIDPAAQDALWKAPEPLGERLDGVGTADYPPEAWRAGVSAGLLARLTITAEGRVSDCAVVSSSGRADLDAKACEVWLRKGRFKPAIGADGVPTAAKIIASFIWSIG
ncbi:MAG: hypothetical protein QOH04_66 [Sphingomonadales bacterium]|nr:hypothetical protein [Sphingomonadales bacterium]